MNVNPVAAPGLASTGQMTRKVESQQASASARENVRHDRTMSPAGPQDSKASGTIEHSHKAEDGDRQKAEQLKALIGDRNMQLSTYHDEASGRSILEVRDQTTGDVVGQYPSEELIRLYAALRQSFFDKSA